MERNREAHLTSVVNASHAINSFFLALPGFTRLDWA